MLIDNKNYKARNGKTVYNVLNRKTMTNESIVSYYTEWIKQNKDVNILKDEIVNKLSSGIKFPMVGVMYLEKEKKWFITNWTLDGRYDIDRSPNDLITML